MKLVRIYEPVNVYDEPESYQKALYKPTPEELKELREAEDLDSVALEMTGLHDYYAGYPGGRYEHYSFKLTPAGYLSATCHEGLDV